MKWKLEPNIKEKSINAFLDLAILCRLMNKPMSGYAITSLLVKETGILVSPGMIYNTLYSMEINGLVKCIRKKPGRVYSLTEQGIEMAAAIPNKHKEIQAFLKILLYDNRANLLKDNLKLYPSFPSSVKSKLS